MTDFKNIPGPVDLNYQRQRRACHRPPAPKKKPRGLLSYGLIYALCIPIASGFFFYTTEEAGTDQPIADVWNIKPSHIADSLTPSVVKNEYPDAIPLKVGDQTVQAAVRYHTEDDIKTCIDNLLRRHRPDFAAVVAMQPESGSILAMSSYIHDGEPFGNLAVHSEFPAASLFKIVTAAAALDQGLATPQTVYEFNGKSTSLYKKNVLRHKRTKWTREVTLEQAFAKSVNTVFGQLGIFHVGGQKLGDYAKTFGFDQPLNLDINVADSRTDFDPSNDWSVAEVASGYTRSTTISPLHAAMIVSAIVNDGVLIEPRLVEVVMHPDGPLIYQPKPAATAIIDADTARDMRALMRDTVHSGSARKSFSKFFRGPYKNLDVGGKTGSLSGSNPRGRTEWFAGYGDSGDDQLAVASVIVSKEKWRVKPAYLTREVIEYYFGDRSKNCS